MKKPKKHGSNRICVDCSKVINIYHQGDKCYQCESEDVSYSSPGMSYRQSGKSGRAINRTEMIYSGTLR